MALARVRGPGHPDQACDGVAAAIVEEYVRRDSASRLNIRVAGGQGAMFVAGEVLSSADFDVSAVVRRTLGANGVTATLEPFIACEPMAPGWGPLVGAREPINVIGYATIETAERVPKSVALARQAARALEERRTQDPEWFWLGTDYEVVVEDGGAAPLIVVRAEHTGASTLSEVRERITHLMQERGIVGEVRVNPAGEEGRAGLAARMGSSGRAGSADQYGSALPASLSGVGFHPAHPLNVGAWIAQKIARELVEVGEAKAALVQATWLPLEARPSFLRIRNERGQDLSSSLDANRFDLSQPPPTLLTPSSVTQTIRVGFENQNL